MVVRLIKTEVPSFDELGLPPQIAQLALLKRGLVLMVGAAGTGKSTTMAAMVAHRAAMMDGHILSVEDPIEYLYPHGKAVVEQREVGIDTLSFGEALKNAMRQAPDVIVIGEIRDRETAKSAIMYAEAGALCISTLHSNNANQAIDRIVEFLPRGRPPTGAARSVTQPKGRRLPTAAALTARRIGTCHRGTIAVRLLVLADPEGRDRLAEGRDQEGHRCRHADLRRLAASNSTRPRRISQEEALNHADSKTDLALKIRLLGGTN